MPVANTDKEKKGRLITLCGQAIEFFSTRNSSQQNALLKALQFFKDDTYFQVSVPSVPIIDCDADPCVPDGWEVEEHRKGGQLVWDPTQIQLYLSHEQQGGRIIQGHELRKELVKKPVLNACVLDWLLAYPEYIFEGWRVNDKIYIYFWGTVYRDTRGYHCVRYLCRLGDKFTWGFRYLKDDCKELDSAAMSVD